MNGRLLAGFIVVSALVAGAALYYLQVYHFYEPVEGEQGVALTSLRTGAPEMIDAENIVSIDARSSPIRYRSCFSTSMRRGMLSQTYVPAPAPMPLTAPSWFSCFNAGEIGEALASGEALAFLGQRNIAYGVDRIVAIFEDGRGFAWHQLNDCGQKAYDGTQTGPDCPARQTESD